MWGVNDYPYRNNSACGSNGVCGYAMRNCTDFSMWRVTNDLGHPCIGGLGNALTWGSAARARGFAVDGNVQLHDTFVAQPGQIGAGSAGHVGMVLQVISPTRFVAEQYNYGVPVPCCCYSNSYSFSTAGLQFIHWGGGPPPPPPCGGACTGGATCVNNRCLCPAGTGWNGQACVPLGGGHQCPPGTGWNGQACAPVAQPGGSSGSLMPLVILAGAAGLGYYEAQRHREGTSRILHDTTAFGGRHDHLSLPSLRPAAQQAAPRGRAVRAQSSSGFQGS